MNGASGEPLTLRLAPPGNRPARPATGRPLVRAGPPPSPLPLPSLRLLHPLREILALPAPLGGRGGVAGVLGVELLPAFHPCGIDLAGPVGTPVYATGEGVVTFAGWMRGYGNLIILKHNNTYLTAYAHNQTLLVKEDQNVRRGQKIAEMGSTDADRVKLHFEVRRQGKPVDPARYLPAR